MQPDRYEISSAGRHRLSGTLQKRSTKLGMSTVGGFLVGGLFVAIGLAIVRVVPMASAAFTVVGLMVWGMAWRQLAAERFRQAAALRHPGEPALVDYPWHPDGFTVSEWTDAAKMLAAAIGLSLFLSIFNFAAFGINKLWLFIPIVGLFDIVAVAIWVMAAKKILGALKFSHSRVEFVHFPCRLPEPVVLRWQPSRGINQINQGTFTLRCVEEWMERSGCGQNQVVTLVHEEIWSAKGMIEQPRNFPLHDAVELRYELPADSLPTRLSADKPLFWELEVKLNLPGLDFNETYLVPIYGA